jgi:hypothetical protein
MTPLVYAFSSFLYPYEQCDYNQPWVLHLQKKKNSWTRVHQISRTVKMYSGCVQCNNLTVFLGDVGSIRKQYTQKYYKVQSNLLKESPKLNINLQRQDKRDVVYGHSHEHFIYLHIDVDVYILLCMNSSHLL